MKLRELEKKDAPFMLEWMLDEDVTKDLHANFRDKHLEDCLRFIEESKTARDNIHFAIVNDLDEYMGTVSLKNIDMRGGRAEFAIAVRKKAMGCGYSWYAMREMLKFGFEKQKLRLIYWCVSKSNFRACKFYVKHGFRECSEIDSSIILLYKGINNLKWFSVSSDDDFLDYKPSSFSLFKTIPIKTVVTEGSGQLSFVEGIKDIPFQIKRLYYITKVDEGVKRGFHAHKCLKQLLFCPYGKVSLLFDNGTEKREILLDSPSLGVLVEKPLWREMVWIEKNSVLCVLASELYSEEDYIRDYQEFLEYIKKEVIQ